MKFLMLILITLTLNAKHLQHEQVYQKIFCDKMNGQAEYVLDDKTRVDCLTHSYAIEVDFAEKWAESIGQSLYYSIKTGKRAGVLLILEQPHKERKYLRRLERVAKEHGITVWTINRNMVANRQ